MTAVRFSSKLDKFQLLELDDEKLLNAINDGENVVIKGYVEDEAILCTNDSTHRIRAVHTSNLHMLLRDDLVESLTGNTLEVVRIPPKLERLHAWLMTCPYEGPDMETDVELLSRLHCNVLFKEIQASDMEILRELSACGAILLDSCYRIIGEEYTKRFFRYFWSVLTLNDWNGTMSIPKVELIMRLAENDEFPENVITKLLDLYGQSDQEEGWWRLGSERVCRFFADAILRKRNNMSLNKLMEEWTVQTGDVAPHPSMLMGIALQTPIPGSDGDFNVEYFPHSKLPIEPLARFEALFVERQRWRLLELEMYVEGAARAANVSTMNLIVKYGRISGEGDERVVTPLLPVTPKPTLLR
jgi:sister chromatid cohesion protein DCC1